MKVLLVTNRNPNFPTITEFVEHAIIALGHNLTFFEDRHYSFPGILRQRIPTMEDLDLHLINKRLLSEARRVQPDILLVLGGSRIFPATVSAMKKNARLTVLWTVDPPVDFVPERAAAPRYDKVFCGGSEAVEILSRDGVSAQWLPFACDTKSYNPISVTDSERAEFGSDIVFIGSYYPNRWDIFEQLSNFNFTIWGPGWTRAGCAETGGIRIREAQLHFETQRKIYASSKIILIAHLQDGVTPCYQASPKVYEAMACEAFVVCDRQRDVFSLFRDREQLVGFDSIDDLKAKLEHFLAHSSERTAIAHNARQEVLARHDYFNRLAKLFEACLTEANQ